MVSIFHIPFDQTTAVTDAVLAIIAIASGGYIRWISKTNSWKTTLWFWLFVLLAFSAALGTIAHGLKMPSVYQSLLWDALYLTLGLLVGLFMVAVIHDIWGKMIARKALPIIIVMALGFFVATLVWPDNFSVFILYEASVMLFALGGYLWLASRSRLVGAWWMVFGIFVTVIAAYVQTRHGLSFTLIWPFNHNGVYHLLQMIGIVFLVAGLRKAERNP